MIKCFARRLVLEFELFHVGRLMGNMAVLGFGLLD